MPLWIDPEDELEGWKYPDDDSYIAWVNEILDEIIADENDDLNWSEW